MAWVQNRKKQFKPHWFVVDDNGAAIGGEYKSREEAEKACAAINSPGEPEIVADEAPKVKKRAKKK